MEHPVLYRKRIIPEECIRLRDDIILDCNEDYILTSWNALKPRKDLHHGYSCYFLKDGIKVSKFCADDRSLLCWYCDIVEYDYDPIANTMTVVDLLADVVIYPDGFVKVMDLDELVTALEAGLITEDALKLSLLTVNRLLEIIYSGNFATLQKYINEISGALI